MTFHQDLHYRDHKLEIMGFNGSILNFLDQLCMDHMKHDFNFFSNIIWSLDSFYNNHNYYDLYVSHSKI